jgi:hypothetical protein
LALPRTPSLKALWWPIYQPPSIAQKTIRLSDYPRLPQKIATPPIDAIRNAPIRYAAALQQLSAHGINSLAISRWKQMHFTTLLRFASPRQRFAQPVNHPLKKNIGVARKKAPASTLRDRRARQTPCLPPGKPAV